MKKTLQIFKNSNYARMFFATLTSEMGTVIGSTALLFFILSEFYSKPYLATLSELMMTLPILFVFFLIGVVADRFDRQKVAYYADAICIVLSIILLIATLFKSIPFMFAALFARKMVQSFFIPAQAGIIQGVLKKDQYVTAAGLNQIVISLVYLFGRGIGAVVYWVFGVEGAIIIDVCSFFISFLLVRSCSIAEEVRLPNGSHLIKDIRFKILISEYGAGLKYIWHNHFLRVLISGYFVFGIVNSSFVLIPIFLLKYKLAPDSYEQMAVWEGMAIGGGILLGSMVFTSVSHKFKPTQLLIGGLAMAGILTIAMGFTTNVWIFIFLLFLCEFFLPSINIGIGGLLPSLVDPKYMGRVRGCIQPIVMIMGSLTLGAMSFVFPKFVSIESLFWFVGLAMLGLGLVYFLTISQYYKEIKAIEVYSNVQTKS